MAAERVVSLSCPACGATEEPVASADGGRVAVCAACGTTCAIEGETVTVAAYRDLMRLTDADMARLRHARNPWVRRRQA
jgi:transcription elongation factor Elf1